MGKASTAKNAAKPGKTREHTVPQMYLRHFAQHQARRQYELRVRRVVNISGVHSPGGWLPRSCAPRVNVNASPTSPRGERKIPNCQMT